MDAIGEKTYLKRIKDLREDNDLTQECECYYKC